MKSYSDISKRYMKENKKRTVLTIVGIALATTLLFAIGTFLLSFRDSMISKERKNRNYEFKLNDIPGEKVDKIVKNIEIKNSALVDSNIEYTMNDYNILINKYNDEYYKLIYKGELVEGKIPSSDNEIVIDTITKKKLNVKLGDSLIVKDKENNEVNLKIVGIRKVDMYSSGNELDVDGYFSKIEKSKKYMIYINLKSEKKKQEIISEVIKKADIKLEEGMKEDHGLLLYLTGNGGSDAIDSSIKGLSIFIISIIIICTITVIYNSFNMSVIERIRYYGILKAIGATNRQIKRILYKEGFLMSIIAFPIGCIVGFISLKLGIKIFIGDKFMFTDFKVNFYPIIILITAILVIITVFLSLLAPTRKIKKISAVDAMKNRGEIKVGKIKRRKTRVIEKIFGIEGSMAYKNIRRTPMRFIITLLALTISIVLFNVFYSFMDFAKQAVKGEFMNIAFDAQLEKKNRDGFTNEEIDTIKNNVKCNTMYSLYSKEIVTKINKDNLTDYYYKNTVFEDNKLVANIYGCSGEVELNLTKEYVVEGSIDYDKLKNGGVILVDGNATRDKNDNRKIERLTNYKVGDEIKLASEDNKTTIKGTVIAILNKDPFYGSYMRSMSIYGLKDVLFSDTEEKTNYNWLGFKYDNDKDRQETIEYFDVEDSYSYIDLGSQVEQINSVYSQIEFFVYCFIIVITIISVVNIFNTISTNLLLRKKEFATLKAMGMTEKQLKKTVILEGTLYGIISAIIGGIVSAVLSNIMLKTGGAIGDIDYVFPYLAFSASILVAILVTYIATLIPLRRLRKLTIVEGISDDE